MDLKNIKTLVTSRSEVEPGDTIAYNSTIDGTKTGVVVSYEDAKSYWEARTEAGRSPEDRKTCVWAIWTGQEQIPLYVDCSRVVVKKLNLAEQVLYAQSK